jgi:hypothetical protein
MHLRIRPVLVAVALAALAVTPPAALASGVADLGGHLGIGFSKLFRTDAPGGSLSVGAGVDRAIGHGFRAGASLGYHMLGTTNTERGSLAATLDYSVFDVAAQVSRDVTGQHGLLRLAAGPGMMSAKSDLSSSAGGLAFVDLAVARTAACAALDLTWMTSKPRPIRAGVETGLRIGFLPGDTWTVWDTRVAFHY